MPIILKVNMVAKIKLKIITLSHTLIRYNAALN